MTVLATVTLDTDQLVPGILLAAAVLTALGVIARKVGRALEVIGRLHDLAVRELEHNHGSSIKDDVHGTAIGLGVLQRRFDDHLRDHHHDDRSRS